MRKPSSGSRPFLGAGKWIMVIVTTVAAVFGLLANARYLGLTPWLGLGGVSLADLTARRVSLTPAVDTLTAIGDTLQLAATVTDEHGSTVAGAFVVWAADDSSVITVDSSGAVVARGPGVATVVASVRDHAGRARITVRQRVGSLMIGPGPIVRLPEGATTQLAARALDARGRLVAGRTIHWESADTSIARIDAVGVVSAVTPGRTTLSASTEGSSASLPVEVSLSPASAHLLAGGDQRASAGRRLPEEVAVEVLSRSGRPVPGAVVSFAAAEGVVDPQAATTDRAGRARAWWSVGSQAGRQHLVVTVAGVDSTIVVTAEADPVPANTRVQVAGEVPRGEVGTALSGPVGIRVTDSSGAAVADVPVAWTPVDGGRVEGLAPRTDSLGEAWARWTLGRRAGAQRVRVQVGNPRTMPPFTVTAAALAGPAAAVAIESGAGQGAAVGATLRHPVVVLLADRDGNPAAGGTLRAIALSGGNLPDTLFVADGSGRVRLHWTLGRRAGPQQLELQVGQAAPVRVSARAHPLEPANVVAGAAPRSASAGSTLARPIVFTVSDAYGNPISDVQVAFAPSSGSVARVRVMTDAKGQAAARWRLGVQPGEQTLTATVRGTSVKGSVIVRALRGSRP
jgi:hypothetical protein